MKRVRFSLLSLLVGVVLAGGVGWLNVRTFLYDSELPPPLLAFVDIKLGSRTPVILSRWYGWPMDAYRQRFSLQQEVSGSVMESLDWHWLGFAANIAIGLAIVFGGAGVCEYVIRRRVAKVE